MQKMRLVSNVLNATLPRNTACTTKLTLGFVALWCGNALKVRSVL